MADWNPMNWMSDWSGDSQGKNDKLHQQLTQGSQQAGAFGQQLAGGVGAYDGQLGQQYDYLRGIQNGQNSVSALQLSQGLQQNLATQRSMAASASPANATMAARNASMQMARQGYGLAGQQAVAGLQERNDASAQLMNGLLQGRGQNIQGANAGYGTMVQGYGAGVQNPYQSWAQQNAALLSAGGAAAGAIAASDRNLKTDIEDGDTKADKLLDGLKAYTYKYKDPKFGEGEHFGPMAQDLEAAGLKSAVIDTKEGKVVHGARLALALAATLPRLHKRIKSLEGED